MSDIKVALMAACVVALVMLLLTGMIREEIRNMVKKECLK
jgi:hypothetical protein